MKHFGAGSAFILFEKIPDAFLQNARLPNFAFPDNHSFPVLILQRLKGTFITVLIPLQFRLPVIGIGFGRGASAASVLMPKTAVHKYHFFS